MAEFTNDWSPLKRRRVQICYLSCIFAVIAGSLFKVLDISKTWNDTVGFYFGWLPFLYLVHVFLPQFVEANSDRFLIRLIELVFIGVTIAWFLAMYFY